MELKADFYLVLIVAAVAISALTYLVFYTTGTVGPMGGVTGAVVAGGDVEPVTGFDFLKFSAGMFLVFISAMIIYHFYHHKE